MPSIFVDEIGNGGRTADDFDIEFSRSVIAEGRVDGLLGEATFPPEAADELTVDLATGLDIQGAGGERWSRSPRSRLVGNRAAGTLEKRVSAFDPTGGGCGC